MKQLPAPSAATHVDAAAIAAALGIGERAVRLRAIAAGWPHTKTPQRGGYKNTYPVATLPQDVQDALTTRATALVLQQLPALPCPAPGTAVAHPAGVSPEDSTLAQRQRDLARRLVLRTLRDLQDVQGCSTRKAALQLLHHARTGQLSPAMLGKLQQACDERGRNAQDGFDDTLPSHVTLQRWAHTQASGRSLAPSPSRVPDLRVRGWYRPLFALTDRPQKPTLKWAHEQLVQLWRPDWADAPGAPPPSYDQVLAAYAKRSKVDQLKGRHTGSALRSKMFFHKRTYAGMAPFTEVHADGWTTHFTAPDPKTGHYVTYELWHFHDVATRYVTPMSVGLTENTDVILQGLQNCIRVGGVPCIWQTDHTSSVKNAQVKGIEDDDHAGLAERLGLSVVHPQTVGNSQANGIAENFNTWLDRESRELATYQHPQRMDSGTFVRVRRITNAMVRSADKPAERAALRAQAMKLGKGIVFDTHADALAWITEREQRWNNHPHRELPKVRENGTGRMVHMTPQQSLDAAKAAGWQPVALTETELVDEFRPHLRKRVTRGTVTPFGGMRYHHSDLAHHEGEDVLVAVDRDNPGHVWVKDLQGRLIVEAQFAAAVGPRTESMAEHSQRKRAEAQIRRREGQIDHIEAGIAPAALEMDDGSRVLDLPLVPEPQRVVPKQAPDAPPAAKDARPISFLDSNTRMAALEAAKQAADAADAAQDPEKKVATG